MNTIDNTLAENVAVADIRKELFEGDNIVTQTENTDKGISRLSEEARDNLERALNTTGVKQIKSADSEAAPAPEAPSTPQDDTITMEVVDKKE